MKIGFFTDTYFPQINGVTYTLQTWKNELEKRGHKVSIYYPKSDYEQGEGEIPLKSIEFPFYPGYRITYQINLPKEVEKLDIIHQHGLYSMALIGLKAAKNKKKLLTFHTPGDQYTQYLPFTKKLGGIYNRSYKIWENWILKKYGTVTTASEEINETLAVDAKIISNGVDTKLFKKTDGGELRKKLNLGTEKIIGFAGRLGSEKHLEDLINAAKDFDGKILIAGAGPYEKQYREMAKKEGNISFLGLLDREKLLEFYSILDVFVFPSHCETQGLVALEAMSCGVPVVAAPVLALKTTVENGLTGYHYKVGDSNDLLEKVNLCIKERGKLGVNCRKFADENSIEKSVDEIIKIYEKLLN